MGVGLPEDIFAAVERGIDMFDCVIPTRYGARRHAVHRARPDPHQPTAGTAATATRSTRAATATPARNFPRAYLHHLFTAHEPLGEMLASIHNVRFYQRMMERIRESIEHCRFAELRDSFLREMHVEPEDAVEPNEFFAACLHRPHAAHGHRRSAARRHRRLVSCNAGMAAKRSFVAPSPK